MMTKKLLLGYIFPGTCYFISSLLMSKFSVSFIYQLIIMALILIGGIIGHDN
jgi:hypothetical protein